MPSIGGNEIDSDVPSAGDKAQPREAHTSEYPPARRLHEVGLGSEQEPLSEKPNSSFDGKGEFLNGTLTRIDGKVYDIKSFLDKHPGGSDLLLLAAGRDATVMFRSYHRNLGKAQKFLASLEVSGATKSSFKPAVPVQVGTFDGEGKSSSRGFYDEVRVRVNRYFYETGQSSRGGAFMLFKTIVCLGICAAAYYLGVVRGNTPAAMFMGFMLAVVGLSIQHDANHGALSASSMVNRAFGFCDDLIGGSALCWRHQHVVAHHADPNDAVLDTDSYENWPLMRLNPALPRLPHHGWQHVYGPALFTLLGMAYTINDMVNVFTARYGHTRMHKLRAVDLVLFWLGKALHIGGFYVLPFYLHGIAALWTVVLPMQMTGSAYLATSFIVSHNSEGVEYNVPRDVDWGEMQVRTAVNWSVMHDPETPTVWAWFWLLAAGGLNYQIEHHLFPGVCHVHYPAMSRIVRQVCAERGVPYNAYPSYARIVASHLRLLHKLGQGKDDDLQNREPRVLGAPIVVEEQAVFKARVLPGEMPVVPAKGGVRVAGGEHKEEDEEEAAEGESKVYEDEEGGAGARKRRGSRARASQ